MRGMRIPGIANVPGIPGIPGPADVLTAAAAVQRGVNAAVDDMVLLVDVIRRAGDLLTRVEPLIGRLETVTGEVEQAVKRVDGLIDDAGAAVSGASEVITLARGVAEKADAVVDRAAGVADESDAAVGDATVLMARTGSLLDTWAEVAAQAHPWVSSVTSSVDRIETAAVVDMFDRLPRMAEHLDNDVLPLLSQLDRVGPDLNELLQTVQDLNGAVKRIPGLAFFRRTDLEVDIEAEAEAQEEVEPGGHHNTSNEPSHDGDRHD